MVDAGLRVMARRYPRFAERNVYSARTLAADPGLTPLPTRPTALRAPRPVTSGASPFACMGARRLWTPSIPSRC